MKKQKYDFLGEEKTISKITDKTCKDFISRQTECNQMDIYAYITPYNCHWESKDDNIKNYETC